MRPDSDRMQHQPSSASTGTLSPSDVVYFNASSFTGLVGKAKSVMAGKTGLVYAEEKVPAADLGTALLATALLANEQAGAVRLEMREKKEVLGLKTVQTLYVEPTGEQPAWPVGSLEARFLEAVPRSTSRELDDVYYQMYAEDASLPWHQIAFLVVDGLKTRQLLQTIEKKRLKIFKSTEVVVPDSTRALAAGADVEPARALISSAQARPDFWEIVTREIGQAVNRRKEMDTSDGPDFD